jgi:multiple sugar transport system ATP-binding protein
LYMEPSNLFVAGFIGSPSMNFMRKIETDVVIGVRPHQVVIGEGEYQGTVEAIERLGFETLVHLLVNDEPCCARIETMTGLPQVGDVLQVGFDGALRFDAASEQRIV